MLHTIIIVKGTVANSLMGKAGNTIGFTLALFWETPELIVFRTIIITRSDNNSLLEPLNIENFSPQSVNLTKLQKKKTKLFCHVECLAYELGQ